MLTKIKPFFVALCIIDLVKYALKNTKTMRKTIFAAAILLAVVATSCGSKSTESTTTADSSACCKDSSTCCTDSLATVVPVDTNREDAGPKVDNPN